MEKKSIKFYCVKGRHKVKSDNYRIVRKKVKGNTRDFAVSKCQQHNIEMWRVL